MNQGEDTKKKWTIIICTIIVFVLAATIPFIVGSLNDANTGTEKMSGVSVSEPVKVTMEAVTSDAVSADAVVSEAVTNEAVSAAATEVKVVTPQSVTPETIVEAEVTPTPEPVQEQMQAPEQVQSPVQEQAQAVPQEVIPEQAPEQVQEQPVYVAPQPSYSGGDGIFATTDASYFDDALFVGDSRTIGLYLYGTLKNATYFADTGMSASQAATKVAEHPGGMTFQNMLQSRAFGKVYILFGINEISSPPEGIRDRCQDLINMVHTYQPNAIVYIQANPHVTPSRNASDNRFNNTRINALNVQLATLANNVNVFYIDVNEVFDDETGCMRQECSSDGIHMKARYYTDWCNWLCTKAVPR